MEQAETYWNLITKVKPSSLHRLTKCVPSLSSSPQTDVWWDRYDDEIVEAFTAAFPEIVGDDERIKKVNEDEMKSADGKARWRACMKSFESHPELDYNFGSLVRADCEKDYSEENSIFGESPFYRIRDEGELMVGDDDSAATPVLRV
jgi:hypothetical protein